MSLQGLRRHVPCKPYSIANETKPRPANSSAMPILHSAVKNAPCYLLVGLYILCVAARSVFFMSDTIVMGPTPPGTGVI